MVSNKKAPTQFASRMDECGNSIVSYKNDNIIKVYLKLKAETHRRKLGFINTNTSTFHVKRKKGIHLYRAFNAYGFNERLIRDAKFFDKIRLSDEFCEWLIPTSFILDKKNAKCLNYQKLGFEKQVFVSLESIEEFRRPARF